MPGISHKGHHVPPSPIRKLTPYAENAKKQGKKVYHLNIGQPDIPTPEGMLEAVKRIDFKIWAYTPSDGIPSYRNKLAGYYQRNGYAVDANDLIITNGGSEALLFAIQACIDENQELIVPEPFYANYNGFTAMAGVKIKPVTSRIENGFALPSIEEFEKQISSSTKGILLCNPNNPTGYLYSREELERLKTLALKYDLFILCDEAYREFCYDGQEFLSPMHLEGLAEHAIVLDTVSKRYSACGARIGALLTKNREVLQAVLKLAQTRLSPPAIGQIAAEAAIDTPDAYFEKVLSAYTSRRDLMVEALRKIPGVICPMPRGAFYATVKLPVDNADRFCQWVLEHFSYQNQTVMMAPASGFYSTPGIGTDEVRLAYVLNREDLSKAITCLEKALEAYNSR